jgi:hypothetical protein
MARGKDGYRSLLAKEDGGPCDTIVSEENGILISMMLRQYFMSLKVVDQWRHWGPSLHRHWSDVVDKVSESHPVVEPKSSEQSPVVERQGDDGSSKRKRGWDAWSPAKLRQRRGSLIPADHKGEDTEDEAGPESNSREDEHSVTVMDRELSIMRKVIKKWCRLTGVHGQACDSLADHEFEVHWTRAVAPRLEGRIKLMDNHNN